ncbi:hypothetical protein VPH35_133270 [Triticum aestivum]
MSFTGKSVISGGKLLGDNIIDATTASRYHLLVVDGHSRTHGSICSCFFIIGSQCWRIYYIRRSYCNHVTLRLCLVPGTIDPVKAHFEFSFVEETDKQEPTRIHGGSKLFEFRDRCDYHTKVLKTEFLEKFIRDDSFTIRCDVMVLDEDVLPAATSSLIPVPPPDLQQNFMDLLVAGEGTDVISEVDGETFNAHKCVLAARSTFFRTLFLGPMKEGTSSTPTIVQNLQIDDMHAAVFNMMLGFIHGDSLPAPPVDENEGILLQHLLIAADRFDLRRLRAVCEKKLCEYIDIGSATTILTLADQHSCDGLKNACCRFLNCQENMRAAVDTEEFDHLKKICPHLMKEILISMLPSPSLIQYPIL